VAQTWTELLDDIKVRSMCPTSQNTYTAARFLRLANAVLISEVVPIVDKIHDGYYSYDVDTTLNATGLYSIHARAVGAKLIDLSVISGNGRKGLTLYSESDVENYDASSADPGFFIKRNTIILNPKVPSTLGPTLRQTIILSPATIVDTTDAAQITNINTGSGVVTCSLVPSTWTTANIFDFVMANAHYDTLGIDTATSAVTTGVSGTLTFAAAALPSTLAVGDWISLARQSPVIQCPEVVLPLLAQRVANICLRSLTDLTAYKLGTEASAEMETKLLAFLDPRVQAQGKKIVNRTGILRRGM
jgi:hypothetical protein